MQTQPASILARFPGGNPVWYSVMTGEPIVPGRSIRIRGRKRAAWTTVRCVGIGQDEQGRRVYELEPELAG